MSDYYQNPDPNYGHSQGDLIQVAPHVLVPSLPLRNVILGEDGGIAETTEDSSDLIVKRRSAIAIIMSADCMLDKPNTQYWQICPVLPLASLPKDVQTSVRKSKQFQMLHLPAHVSFPDSFVDFGVITTVSKDVIQAATRLTTLSDLARRALYIQHLRYVSRWDFKTVTCPSCFEEMDLASKLVVRAE